MIESNKVKIGAKTVKFLPKGPTPPPVGAQAIDQTWLTANATAFGGPPYVLGKSFSTYSAATYYYLTTDVTTNHTAFLVIADGITLDTYGHNLTYGNLPSLNAPLNGGFESGTGTTVPNWDLSGASTASICSASDHFLFGSQALRFLNPSTAQVITSDSFTIDSSMVPSGGADGITCAATCTPSWPGGGLANGDGTLLLEVVSGSRSSPGSVVASNSNTLAVARGTMNVATWQPSSTGPFFIRITWTPPSGYNQSLDIDDVKVTATAHYAVVVAQAYPGGVGSRSDYWGLFPAAIQSYYASNWGHAIVSFWMTNSFPGQGLIARGQQAGYGGGTVYAGYQRQMASFTNLTCTNNGDNVTSEFVVGGLSYGNVSGDVVFCNNVFTYPTTPNVSDHYVARGVLSCSQIGPQTASGSSPTFTMTNNTIIGFPQNAVLLSLSQGASHTISNNYFSGNSRVADAYAINVAGVSNLRIQYNSIISTNGYSLGLDQWSNSLPMVNVDVSFNNIVQSVGGNRENGNGGYGYAIKHRNSGGISTGQSVVMPLTCHIHDNSINVTVNSGDQANGTCIFFATLNQNNVSGTTNTGSLVYNNYLKCIVTTSDTSYTAAAFTLYGLDSNIQPAFYNNTFESNDTVLRLGSTNDDAIYNAYFQGNTHIKSSEGDQTRPWYFVYAGYSLGSIISGVYLLDVILQNGASIASSYWYFQANSSKTVQLGYTATVNVQHSSTPVSGATVTVTNQDNSTATVLSGVVPTSYTYPSPNNVGTTDTSGNWSNIGIITDSFTGTWVGLFQETTTHTQYSPLKLAASGGGFSGSTTSTPTTGATIPISIS